MKDRNLSYAWRCSWIVSGLSMSIVFCTIMFHAIGVVGPRRSCLAILFAMGLITIAWGNYTRPKCNWSAKRMWQIFYGAATMIGTMFALHLAGGISDFLLMFAALVIFALFIALFLPALRLYLVTETEAQKKEEATELVHGLESDYYLLSQHRK